MQIDTRVKSNDEEMEEEEQPKTYKFYWVYYDEEEEFDKLIEACNMKGIRERKLQENLRKVKDRLKLKKSRKSAASKDTEMKIEEKKEDVNDEVEQINTDKKADEEMLGESQESAQDNTNVRHVLFENDNYYNSL